MSESKKFGSDGRQDAGVAHPVERHLAKVEVASSSLVTRSKKIRNALRSLFHTVPWPSGKARVCKTLIRQFKSGRYLQNKKDIHSDVLFVLEKQSVRFEDQKWGRCKMHCNAPESIQSSRRDTTAAALAAISHSRKLYFTWPVAFCNRPLPTARSKNATNSPEAGRKRNVLQPGRRGRRPLRF